MHKTCDDPDCATCNEREREAAIRLRQDPGIQRVIRKFREAVKQRAKRPRA